MWASKDKSNLMGPSARKPRVLVLVVCLSMLAFNTVQSQAPWPAIPGIDEGQASVHSQETFVPALALAALSFGFARWIDESERAHRAHGRIGIYGLEGYWVFNQTVGVEQQVTPWFSLSWEFLVQEWAANDSSGNKAGAGIGLIPYAKWTALSTHRLSPFVEIGTGAFYGFQRFPASGTRFTFHLNTNLGVAWKLNGDDVLRLTYGHLHQSNNGLGDRNPGIVGNGATVTWSRRFRSER